MIEKIFFFYFEAFHDCVGPPGCDGCVNQDRGSNKGLKPLIDTLVAIRNREFWVSLNRVDIMHRLLHCDIIIIHKHSRS